MVSCNVFPVIDLQATGRNIERLRRMVGLTVRDAQTCFGFEYPQAVCKWQHGECLLSVDNLLALSKLLRVPMEDLPVYDNQEVSFCFWRTAGSTGKEDGFERKYAPQYGLRTVSTLSHRGM